MSPRRGRLYAILCAIFMTALVLQTGAPVAADEALAGEDVPSRELAPDGAGDPHLPSSQVLVNATQVGGDCGSGWTDLNASDDRRCSFREVNRAPANETAILLPDGTDVSGWSSGGKRGPCSRDTTPYDELDDGANTDDGDATCREGSRNGNRVGVTLQDPVWTDPLDVDDFDVTTSAVVRKTGNKPASFAIDVKVGSSGYSSGTTQSTTTSYVRYARFDGTNPTTAPSAEWTGQDIADLTLASRCVDCSPAERVTQMQARVDARYDPEYALEVRFAWSGIPVTGDRWTLLAECRRLSPGSERVLVQVGRGGGTPTDWATAYVCDSDEDQGFGTYVLDAAELNGGAPVVRIWDAQADAPDDTLPGTMALDLLRIEWRDPWPYEMTEAQAANRTMLWVYNTVWTQQPSAVDEYAMRYGTKHLVVNGYPLGAAYTASRGYDNIASTFTLTPEFYDWYPNRIFEPVKPFELRPEIRGKLAELRPQGFRIGFSLVPVLNYSMHEPCHNEREAGQGHVWAWSRNYNASQGVDCVTFTHFTREYDFFSDVNLGDMREAIDAVAPWVDYVAFDEIFYGGGAELRWDGEEGHERNNTGMCEASDPTATNWQPDLQQEFMSRYGYTAEQLEWLRTWNGTYHDGYCDRSEGDPYWPDLAPGNRALYDDWVEFKGDILAEWYEDLAGYAHGKGLETALSVLTPTGPAGYDPVKYRVEDIVLDRLLDSFDIVYATYPGYSMGNRDAPSYYTMADAGETMRQALNPDGTRETYGAIEVITSSSRFANPANIAFNFFAQAYATHDGLLVFELGDPGGVVRPSPWSSQPWGNGWEGTAYFPSLNASAPYCRTAAREIPRFGPLLPEASGDVAVFSKRTGIPDAQFVNGTYTFYYPTYYSNHRNFNELVDLLSTFTGVTVVSSDSDLDAYENITLATDYFPEDVDLSGKRVLGLGQPLWNDTAEFCDNGGPYWRYYNVSQAAADFWGFHILNPDANWIYCPKTVVLHEHGSLAMIRGDINADGLAPFRQTFSRDGDRISTNPGTFRVRRLLLADGQGPYSGYTGASAFATNDNATVWDVLRYGGGYDSSWATEFIRSDLRRLGWYERNDRFVTDGVFTLHFADWLPRQPLLYKDREYFAKEFDADGNMTIGTWAYKEAYGESEFGEAYWEARLRPYETMLALDGDRAEEYAGAPEIHPPSTYVKTGPVDYGLVLERLQVLFGEPDYVAHLYLRPFADDEVTVDYAAVDCVLPHVCTVLIKDVDTGNDVTPLFSDERSSTFAGVAGHHYVVTVERSSP